MDSRGFDELKSYKIQFLHGKWDKCVGTELDKMVLRQELISEAFVMKCITPHASFHSFVQ